jgi:hypothetical protein
MLREIGIYDVIHELRNSGRDLFKLAAGCTGVLVGNEFEWPHLGASPRVANALFTLSLKCTVTVPASPTPNAESNVT